MKNSLIPRIKNACLQTSSLAVSILIILSVSQSAENVVSVSYVVYKLFLSAVVFSKESSSLYPNFFFDYFCFFSK